MKTFYLSLTLYHLWKNNWTTISIYISITLYHLWKNPLVYPIYLSIYYLVPPLEEPPGLPYLSIHLLPCTASGITPWTTLSIYLSITLYRLWKNPLDYPIYLSIYYFVPPVEEPPGLWYLSIYYLVPPVDPWTTISIYLSNHLWKNPLDYNI